MGEILRLRPAFGETPLRMTYEGLFADIKKGLYLQEARPAGRHSFCHPERSRRVSPIRGKRLEGNNPTVHDVVLGQGYTSTIKSISELPVYKYQHCRFAYVSVSLMTNPGSI